MYTIKQTPNEVKSNVAVALHLLLNTEKRIQNTILNKSIQNTILNKSIFSSILNKSILNPFYHCLYILNSIKIIKILQFN